MNNLIIFSVIYLLLILSILASSIMQIIYGIKINGNDIDEGDKGAGIFFIIIGVLSILFSGLLGYVAYANVESMMPKYVRIIMAVYALLVFASSFVLIIYGNKIRKLDIEDEDDPAGRFMISLGTINIIVVMMFIAFVLYYVYPLFKKPSM